MSDEEVIAMIDNCFELCSCQEDSDGPCEVCDYLIHMRKELAERAEPKA